MTTLITLALVFTHLSLFAFGGGNAILPALQHQVVDVQQWISLSEFNTLFAISQAAPGPNMMIVPLIGWHVAGPMGLMVSAVAKFIPSSIITALAIRNWDQFKNHPIRMLFQVALQPITVSLVLVGAWMMLQSATPHISLLLIALCGIALSMFKNTHPVYIMLMGAGLGILLL